MHGSMSWRSVRIFYFFSLNICSAVCCIPLRVVGLQKNNRSHSGFNSVKSLSFGLAWNIKLLFCSDHFYFNSFFFPLFLLLLIFTNSLRQYPVISRNYPTYPALERCKGRGRGRTFGAKFLFVCRWHPCGSNEISCSFIFPVEHAEVSTDSCRHQPNKI